MAFVFGELCPWWTFSLVDFVLGGLCPWWTLSLVKFVLGGLRPWWDLSSADLVRMWLVFYGYRLQSLFSVNLVRVDLTLGGFCPEESHPWRPPYLTDPLLFSFMDSSLVDFILIHHTLLTLSCVNFILRLLAFRAFPLISHLLPSVLGSV